MALPNQPVTLTVQQIEELNSKLSHLRHQVNNYISIMTMAADVAQFKPEMVRKMPSIIVEQSGNIKDQVKSFSETLERMLGIAHRTEISPGA